MEYIKLILKIENAEIQLAQNDIINNLVGSGINLIIGLIFIESDKEETRNTGMIIFAPSFLLFFIGVLIALWIYCF